MSLLVDSLQAFVQAAIIFGISYFVYKLGIGLLRAYLGKKDEAVMIGSVSGDDVLDFDKSDVPFIPVRIVKEHNQYYAWFAVNDKFIGQSNSIDEIHKAAYQQVLRQMGLRCVFTQEKIKAKPKTKKGP